MDIVGSGGNYNLQIAFNSRLYNILPFSSFITTISTIRSTLSRYSILV
jgi:hypothetical protein